MSSLSLVQKLELAKKNERITYDNWVNAIRTKKQGTGCQLEVDACETTWKAACEDVDSILEQILPGSGRRLLFEDYVVELWEAPLPED